MDPDLCEFEKSDIFTPEHISEKMASYFIPKSDHSMRLLEPSVGVGDLLKYISFDMYEKIDVFDIKEEYLKKCVDHPKITKHHSDFLQTSFENTSSYTHIIMNPPFIRIQDLSDGYRSFIKQSWPMLKGNFDIYYAFILKCIDLLDEEHGVFVAITPNSYLFNKSGIELRKYLFEHRYIREIIDYKSEKVFKEASTYCAITIFDKTPKSSLIYNNQIISYDAISTHPYMLFSNGSVGMETKTLEEVCIMRNGIATLRDSIYIHKERMYEESCWKPITNGRHNSWVIYPYDEDGKIIDEAVLASTCPQTYAYLVSQKEELAKRDYGKKTYAAWYAYGRTQSVKRSHATHAIYLPTLIDPEDMSKSLHIYESMLFYGCLSIELKEEVHEGVDLNVVIDSILKAKEYIKNQSSKRGSGWINLSSTLLKTIPLIQSNI